MGSLMKGIHTLPNQGKSQSWLTPPDLLKLLGKFDLDPCCPPFMPYETATRMLSNNSRAKESSNPKVFYVKDGCEAKHWKGRVFLNCPYSAKECERWLNQFMEHGNGICLAASRTETEWFQTNVFRNSDAILFLRGRLHFHLPDGSRAKGNAGHGSVLVACGEANVALLKKLNDSGKLYGKMFVM